MKKIILSLSILCASLCSYGQNREVRAEACEAFAEKQGSYTPSFKADGRETKVRNVILLIGDGMGIGAVNAAMYANGGELTMTNLRTMGYVRTQSASDFTTDSAASGTAYACGIKTNNGYLGMTPDKKAVQNIPEKISPMGFACGVISTDDLNGATPAAFFAHQPARGMTEEIWADLPGSSLTFVSAGTHGGFEQQSLRTREGIGSKFTVVYSLDNEAEVDASERLAYFPESVKLDRGAYLPNTTRKAIEYLSERGKKGFFLMVEGARIDKESHSNNFDSMIKEALDFDKAVEEAVRFAEKDGHTLVIVSADHETGALTLGKNGDMREGYITGVYSSKSHTPMTVPLFAYGPWSHAFAGIQENSDVSNKIVSIITCKTKNL